MEELSLNIGETKNEIGPKLMGLYVNDLWLGRLIEVDSGFTLSLDVPRYFLYALNTEFEVEASGISTQISALADIAHSPLKINALHSRCEQFKAKLVKLGFLNC